MTYKNQPTPWRDEDRLRELYWGDGLTQSEIADKLDTSQKTVSDWFGRHGIETRRGTPDELRDEDWLKQQYVIEGKSMAEIANDISVCQKTVHNWLNKHGIETRTPTYDKPPHFRTRKDGYEEVKSKVNGETKSVLVHRLLAVAEYGVETVSNNWIHHQNQFQWDNRHENIEVMSAEEHGRHHSEQRERDGEGNYA